MSQNTLDSVVKMSRFRTIFHHLLNTLLIIDLCYSKTTPTIKPNPTNIVQPDVSYTSAPKFETRTFIVIDIESKHRQTNFSSFSLEKPSWFDVVLPSLQVDLILIFNSSSPNISAPSFDVKGTFCTKNDGKNLFSGLKGSVSKMISRKDLISLKARTGCNLSSNGEKPRYDIQKLKKRAFRVYLNAIPTSKIQGAVGTLYAFLLHNQTSASGNTMKTTCNVDFFFIKCILHSFDTQTNDYFSTRIYITKNKKRRGQFYDQ